MADHKGVALVTGAGSGIGRACARALLRDGWAVAMTGRREDALNETAEGQPPDRVLSVPADVSKPDQVEAVFKAIVDRWGRLDLLFNNAGLNAPAKPIGEIDLEAWRLVIDVNVTGVFLCTRAAFRIMRDQDPRGGRIVNNGSISAHVPRPGSSPYTTSKHAVSGLTKSTALDGRAFDIVCGQIDIGNAQSPLTARMTQGVPQANGSTAVEPVMNVEHVADALVYMANLPLDANVHTLTVMASKMPFVGRG